MGEPSSMAPSLSESIASPCQWVRSASGPAFVTSMRDGDALTQTKQWAGNLAVEAKRLYGDAGADVERAWLDAKRVVGLRLRGLRPWMSPANGGGC